MYHFEIPLDIFQTEHITAMEVRLVGKILVLFFCKIALTSTDEPCGTCAAKSIGTTESLERIFMKYEKNESSVISQKSFRRLLRHLEIGRILLQCEENDLKCRESTKKGHNGGVTVKKSHAEDRDGAKQSTHKMNNHDEHKGVHERRRRSIKSVDDHEKHWKHHLKQVKPCIKL